MGKLYKLRYLDFVEKGEDIWFSNLSFNALIKLNKNTGRIEIIDKFPNYKVEEQWLYIAIYLIENKLFFIPHQSQEIVSYDITTRKFTSFALDLDIVGKKRGYFLSAYAYKNFIYMFPAYTRYIVRFDILNNSITYLDLGLNTALRNLSKEVVCFIKEFEIIGHKIYIPFAMLNAIAVFDLEHEQLEIKYLNIVGGCTTINYIKGYFYLASCKNCHIYRWDEETGEIIVYDDFPVGFTSKNYIFSCSYSIENKIIFMPLESNMILSLNLYTKDICCEKKIINGNKGWWNTYFIKRNNEKFFLLIEETLMLCLLEHNNKNLKYTPLCIGNDLFNKRKIIDFLGINMCSSIQWETKIALEEYIEILEEIDVSTCYQDIKQIGEKIYEECKKI